jgi:hypothetical protein
MDSGARHALAHPDVLDAIDAVAEAWLNEPASLGQCAQGVRRLLKVKMALFDCTDTIKLARRFGRAVRR